MVQPRVSRFKSDIRIKPGKAKKAEPTTRMCEAPDCVGPGNCRVSKSPRNLSEYIWYCSTHARLHNEAWDYFKDMDDDEIQKFREDALTGHRPTWGLGVNAAPGYQAAGPDFRTRTRHGAPFRDAFGFFGETARPEPGPQAPARRKPRTLERQALQTLGVDETASLNEIKSRYKELVKKHHPDANGGDRSAEERLRKVIQAYDYLRKSGFC